MKRITAVMLLVAILLCGCGQGATSSGGEDKKPNTSCTLSDGCDESAEGGSVGINLDAKSGQEAIENAMKAVQTLNEEGVSRYLGADFWEWSLAAKDENNFAIVKRAFPYMTYEFTGFETLEGNTVNGTVKIKCLDLGRLYMDVQLRLEDWYQAMALEGLEVTYEGKTNELYRIFQSELDDPDTFSYYTSEVTLQAYKTDSSDDWYLARSDAFVRALFGTVTWGGGMD